MVCLFFLWLIHQRFHCIFDTQTHDLADFLEAPFSIHRAGVLFGFQPDIRDAQFLGPTQKPNENRLSERLAFVFGIRPCLVQPHEWLGTFPGGEDEPNQNGVFLLDIEHEHEVNQFREIDQHI